ncbi:uncharacterized protein METZ01_LOCUS426071, partial [marine metagenome]
VFLLFFTTSSLKLVLLKTGFNSLFPVFSRTTTLLSVSSEKLLLHLISVSETPHFSGAQERYSLLEIPSELISPLTHSHLPFFVTFWLLFCY